MQTPRVGFGYGRAFSSFYVIGGYTVMQKNFSTTTVTNEIEVYNSQGRTGEQVRARACLRKKHAARTDALLRAQPRLGVARAYPLVLSSKNRIVVAGGLSDCCQLGTIDV